MKYKIGDLVRDKLSQKIGIVHSYSRISTYDNNEWIYKTVYNVRFSNRDYYQSSMFEYILMNEEELIENGE